jgi:hypothetical protein
MRHIVDKNRARAAFGSVATQLGPREPQFVTERPGQRFLFHDVGSPQLAVHVDGDKPFPRAASRLAEQRGGAEQIACGRDCDATYNHAFY